MTDDPGDDPARRQQIGVGMGGSCPNCRAPLELGQRFCLECGHAVGSPRRRSVRDRRAGSTRRREESSGFPWVPVLTAAGVILLALAAITLSGDDAPSPAASTGSTGASTIDESELTDTVPTTPPTTTPTETTPTTTTPTTTTPPGPGFPGTPSTPTTTTTTPTSATTPTTTATTPTSSTPPGGAGSWPSGVSAWTVVVVSLSKSTYSRQDADERAAKVSSKGIEAGVLDSDGFSSSLNPGYWVVFSRQFDTRAQAEEHLRKLSDIGEFGAYVREVKG